MAYLTLKKDSDVINNIPIDNLHFRIGRLPDSDLLIPDQSVSREHCVVFKDGDDYFIRDLESTNGTFVNGSQIVGGVKLEEGDIIDIGEYCCEFHRGIAPLRGSSGPMHFRAPVEILQERLFVHHPDRLTRNKVSMHFYILHQLAKSLLSAGDLTGVYDNALTMLLQATDAERGVILTLDEQDSLHAVASKHSFNANAGELPDIIYRIVTDAMEKMVTIISSSMDGLREVICSPLWEKSKLYGAVYMDADSKKGSFTENDSELVSAVANMIAIAIKQNDLNEKIKNDTVIRNNLERFLSPDIAKEIMTHSSHMRAIRPGVKEESGTVMFVDIKDFTCLSEKLAAGELTDILNEYFNICTSTIFKYRGSVNKFLGDGVMAVFGMPFPIQDDALSASDCAVEIIKSVRELNKKISQEKRFNVKIGINSGRVIAGNVGSEARMEYTVIGDVVNVAARLEGIAKPEQILIGEGTYEKIRGSFKTAEEGNIWLKGKSQSLRIFSILFD
ncbi:MAG TPA: adenylate/guanylate cyclase domain-containing protein [bacterium]